MTLKKNETIAWVDILRIVACVMVVVSHSCDSFVGEFDTNRVSFLSGVSIGSLMRSCVPLFVMISGVLLLPTKMDMTSFYKRRAKRILVPLIIWGLITPVLYYLYLNHGISHTTLSGINMEDHTLNASLTKMYTFLFNFNYDITPLWYLYMLIGLYLAIPILSPWLQQASKKDMKIFLGIWLITTILPYVQMFAPMLGYTGNYGNMGLLGVCDWNPYGTFYYFSGFIGYLVLANYLMRFPLNWSWKKTWAIVIPIFSVGYLITFVGFLITQEHYPGNYAYLEIVWYFSGINVLMMTVCIFIVFQKIKATASKRLRTVSSLTFGIYLCHFILVQIGYDLIFPNIQIAPYLQIPLIATFAFFASLLVSWILSLNKFTRNAIM